MERADSLEKTLMLGKTEGRRRRGGKGCRLEGITDSMDMNLDKFWEIAKDRKPGMLKSKGSQRIRHNCATEKQQPQKWSNIRFLIIKDYSVKMWEID